MKLSTYAKKLGLNYKTVWRYYKNNLIQGYQTPTGTIIVNDNQPITENKTVIYCRVSSAENKSNLESQKERLLSFCAARGWIVDKVIMEIGSGVNDSRQKWIHLLEDKSITRIVVEHKDRFSRFGFNAYKTILSVYGRDLVVVNESENGKEDIIEDLVSIITSFCARIYGLRRSKRKTERIVKEILDDKKIYS